MKHIALLCFIIITHVNASFFDDFRGAMHNVQRGFEKLLSDVVSDMKDTIDCTILAVEHVLYINGVYKEPSNYSKRCNNDVKPEITYNVKNPDHRTVIHLEDTTILPEIVHETDHDFHKTVISEHLQSSISKINTTLFNIIDDHETTKKIKSISETLRNETNHLTKVSNLLRNELEKISKDVKNRVIENNYNNSSPADTLLKEIKMLQEIENENSNRSEVQEVHGILEEALNELKGNENGHDDKIDEVIKELEKEHHDFNFANIHIGAKAYVDSLDTFDEPDILLNDTDLDNDKESILKHESEAFHIFDHVFDPDINTDEKNVLHQANNIIAESHIADMLFNRSKGR